LPIAVLVFLSDVCINHLFCAFIKRIRFSSSPRKLFINFTNKFIYMKKIISTLLFVLFALGFCHSQDLITKKTGEDIKVKVTEITNSEVKYHKFDDLTGPVYSINKSEILLIKYENGTKDIFTNSNQSQPPVGNQSQPTEGKKISLCGFYLDYSSNTSSVSAISPVAGAIYATSRDSHDRPYFERLKDTLSQIIESMLNEATIFRYIQNGKLQTVPSGTIVTPEVVAKNNDLFACLNVKSALACKMGWKKKLVTYTLWQIRCTSKYKVKISTTAYSQDRKAVFVDISDPKYLPDWIEMQKDNTRQFIEKLTALMKKDSKLQ